MLLKPKLVTSYIILIFFCSIIPSSVVINNTPENSLLKKLVFSMKYSPLIVEYPSFVVKFSNPFFIVKFSK